MFSNVFKPKLSPKYFCENCDYGTCKKSSYTDHLDSAKHKKSMIVNEILPEICSKFICQKCSKKYKDNSIIELSSKNIKLSLLSHFLILHFYFLADIPIKLFIQKFYIH